MQAHDRADEEIEPKPGLAGAGARPLSWGERVEQRKQRRRAMIPVMLRGAISRLLASLARFSRTLGLTRRKAVAEGVVYRQRNNTSLRRALSAAGSGVKEYDVRFPSRGGAMQSRQYPMRESMRIRYTHKRIYADLGHDPRTRFVELASGHIEPGDRVLELGCGTGGSSELLARLVGPSGGVVALHRDGESIRFARQRYRLDHLAFELGWLETLEGELDHAYDAAIVVDVFRDAPDAPSKSRAIASIWRVLAPRGLVLAISTDRNRLDDVTERLEALGIERLSILEPDPTLLWGAAMGFKPAEKIQGA